MSDEILNNEKDYSFMRLAMEEANEAASRDEVPIGALIVHKETGEIIARGGNNTRTNSDPTAHAEIEAIRQACKKTGSQRIPDYDLYVTLEPCTMCAGAISFARINRLIIGAPDPKGGGILHGSQFFEQPTCHHKPEVQSGFHGEECGNILRDFFRAKRDKKKKKKSG